MSTNDVAQRRSAIEDIERKAVTAHLRAESYRSRLAEAILLRDYANGCAQKLYDSMVRKDRSLQGVSLEEHIKGPHVGPTLFNYYRIYCEASARADGLKRMIQECDDRRDQALAEWKHLRSFALEDYTYSVEGFEVLMRSS